MSNLTPLEQLIVYVRKRYETNISFENLVKELVEQDGAILEYEKEQSYSQGYNDGYNDGCQSKEELNDGEVEDKTFKQKSNWTKIDEKPFHYAFLREITDQYESGDISYGKMVEMLNEVAIKWHNRVAISKMETTISKTETVDANAPTQTAVEWLYNNLKSHFEHNGDLLEVVQMSFEQAKQMEKEQIIDAYENGISDENERNLSGQFTNAEQYYNETYNK